MTILCYYSYQQAQEEPHTLSCPEVISFMLQLTYKMFSFCRAHVIKANSYNRSGVCSFPNIALLQQQCLEESRQSYWRRKIFTRVANRRAQNRRVLGHRSPFSLKRKNITNTRKFQNKHWNCRTKSDQEYAICQLRFWCLVTLLSNYLKKKRHEK